MQKWPAAHSVINFAPTPQYRPLAQAMQASLPALGWYFPSAQFSHGFAGFVEKLPASHGVACVLPAGQCVPALHSVCSVASALHHDPAAHVRSSLDRGGQNDPLPHSTLTVEFAQ